MNEPTKPESITFSARIRSQSHAVAGIRLLLASQHNAWIHLAASVLVVLAGFILGISATDWCIVVLAMCVVWVAEALNTALEFLCDVVSPEFHPLVKSAKDVAAGAVLLSAIGALIVGLIVFIPHVRDLL